MSFSHVTQLYFFHAANSQLLNHTQFGTLLRGHTCPSTFSTASTRTYRPCFISPMFTFQSPRARPSNLMYMQDVSSHPQRSLGRIQWKVTAIDLSRFALSPFKSDLGLQENYKNISELCTSISELCIHVHVGTLS